jgi:L-ascorbate metabolism protein UlaG (beta-lactamase superfamily)
MAALVALAGCAAVPVPRRATFHGSDADLGVTRIVHGSLIVEMRGARFLVDPWFYSGLVRRQREPLGLTPESLPSVAAVLLTHAHPDHFDARALRDLAATVPQAVARPELTARLRELGFREVVPLDWWEQTTIADVTITAVPARHAEPENGYVLDAGGVQAYLAGDTRFFPELVDVATRFPALAVALLPVGGERLLGFPREMGPDEAAEAAELLGAKRVIPSGYGERGAFPLLWHAGRPVERFVEACGKRGIAPERIVVLEPGQSWHYYQ